MMKLCNKSLTMMKYLKNSNNDEMCLKQLKNSTMSGDDYKVTTRTAEQARG